MPFRVTGRQNNVVIHRLIELLDRRKPRNAIRLRPRSTRSFENPFAAREGEPWTLAYRPNRVEVDVRVEVVQIVVIEANAFH